MQNSTKDQTLADATPDMRKAVSIVYTNYRGETARRKIVPRRLWYGATRWHPDEQWLLDAFDIEKASARSFALRDIKSYCD